MSALRALHADESHATRLAIVVAGQRAELKIWREVAERQSKRADFAESWGRAAWRWALAIGFALGLLAAGGAVWVLGVM